MPRRCQGVESFFQLILNHKPQADELCRHLSLFNDRHGQWCGCRIALNGNFQPPGDCRHAMDLEERWPAGRVVLVRACEWMRNIS